MNNLIYVAGKLEANNYSEFVWNIGDMLKAGIKLVEKGYAPFVPCSTILMGIVAGNWDYEDYFSIVSPFIKVCDSFLFLCESPGADREWIEATGLKKAIYYLVDEVPDISGRSKG